MAAPGVASIVEGARKKWREQRDSRLCCVRCMVELGHQVERAWDDECMRLALLEVFRECLLDLGSSRHEEVRWMGVLGRKMKSLDFSLTHFLNILLPFEREHTRGLQDYEFLATRITAADGSSGAAQERPRLGALHIVVDNMRSAFNVGSIFRTAECLGAVKVHLCGYTATPNDAHVLKTTMGTHAHVQWAWAQSALETVAALQSEGVPTVALETVVDATRTYDFSFPKPCALLVGNEKHGLGPDLIALCTGVVAIPCVGMKNSLNAGVAVGMCAHEVMRQWSLSRLSHAPQSREGARTKEHESVSERRARYALHNIDEGT